MSAHASDSEVQREAHSLILDWLASPESGLGVPKLLVDQRVRLADNVSVLVDGKAEDDSVFVEVYARVTPIKGAGFHRVASDVLKLRLIKEQYPGARVIIAFASHAAAESITGWRRAAADSAGIELVAADLPDESQNLLRVAQARQRMVNVLPPTDEATEQT